jgi:hypothetical protein
MELNPPFAGAVHCLQAPARSDSCAQSSKLRIFLTKRISWGGTAWRLLSGCLGGGVEKQTGTIHWMGQGVTLA